MTILLRSFLEVIYHKELEKQGDLKHCFVLLTVTLLWPVAQWLSRAPPHHTLPAFLNLNSRTRGRHEKNFGRNPEPTGTHFLGSDSEPGTHFLGSDLEPGTPRNPLFGFRPGTRNPSEPTFWVPTRDPEPTGTHYLSKSRNPEPKGTQML